MVSEGFLDSSCFFESYGDSFGLADEVVYCSEKIGFTFSLSQERIDKVHSPSLKVFGGPSLKVFGWGWYFAFRSLFPGRG